MQITRPENPRYQNVRVKLAPFKWLLGRRFFVRARARFGLEWWGFLIILLVLLLVGFRVNSRSKQAANAGLLGRPLRVGIVGWPGYAGGLVANRGLKPNKDCAFWKRNQYVEFVVINSDEQLRRDFIRGGIDGGIDVMWSTVDSLALQYPAFLKDGIRPRAFMQVDWSRGGDAIVARGGIDQIEHLAGKSIAVSMSPSQWMLEYSLENSDLSAEEKTKIRQSQRILTSGSKESLELFKATKVDAAVLWEPDVSEALKSRSRAKILISSKDADYMIGDVMIAREEFIAQHPDVIDAFIQGWFDGTEEAIKNPMLAVKVLMDHSELGFDSLTEEKIRELLGKTALATLEDNVEMFGLSNGDIFFDKIFTRASHIWQKKGYVTAEAKAADARDASLLKKIWDIHQESVAKTSCGGDLLTVPLSVNFLPNKADLTAEAQRTLDDEDVEFLLRTNSQFRFCIDAGVTEGDDARTAEATKRVRENEVIRYLVEHHHRPYSQFVSASAEPTQIVTDGKAKQYMRLKLVGVRNETR